MFTTNSAHSIGLTSSKGCRGSAALTNSWQLVRNSDDDRRVRAYVLPTWQDRIEQWCKNNNSEGWIFSRYAVLWLMRQAFVVCSPEGEQIDTREKLERLGEACLMANSVAFFPNQPERLTTSLEIAVNTVPNIDVFSRGNTASILPECIAF